MTEQELRSSIDAKIKLALSLATDKSIDLLVFKVAITDAIMNLIKPKELVWDGDGHYMNGPEDGWLEEANPYGDIWYSIEFGRDGNFMFDNSMCDGEDGFKTPDEAKAAAQAHYNSMFYDMIGASK